MRTTIAIDDGLLDDAKRHAARCGTTLSRLIEEALRACLAARQDPLGVPPFRLITAGDGGLLPGVAWPGLAATADELDGRERLGLPAD